MSEAFINEDASLSEEVADLLYHLAVILQAASLNIQTVYADLEKRKQKEPTA